MNKYFIIILIGVLLAEGCTASLPKFKCVYDLYGDSTRYYIITLNEDYLKTIRYRHFLISKYDSLENRWQDPVDSVSEKTDSVFYNRKERLKRQKIAK